VEKLPEPQPPAGDTSLGGKVMPVPPPPDTTKAIPIPGGGEPGDLDEPEGPLPPLPPGWEWTPEGLRWKGPGPEPPELPPGWEWGPAYPGWTGEGEPTDARGIGASEPIPVESFTGQAENHSHRMDISQYLEPGAAFVYQIYGAAIDAQGNTIGVLSPTMCGRYSPINALTGIPADAPPCPDVKVGCKITAEWIKSTPITIDRALDYYPSGDNLKELIPGSSIALSILASDKDKIKQTCKGHEDCEELGEAVKLFGPYDHGVKYTWTKKGPGELIGTSQNTIFYKTPTSFTKDVPQEATITVKLENVGGKFADVPLERSIKFKMTLIDSCKCIDVTAEIIKPKDPEQDLTEPLETAGAKCLPLTPEWKMHEPIKGKLDILTDICPDGMAILKADYTDTDSLYLVCQAADCGRDTVKQTPEDPLRFVWDDGGAGGRFPLGNTGPYVLYKASQDTLPVQVTFTVSITDSGKQFADAKEPKKETKTAQRKKLLDLAEINVMDQTAENRNITVGHSYRIQPTWLPADAKVRKIVWEIDLGGDKGKVRKVLCDPNGFTPATAALALSDITEESALRISWKKRSHIHGIKDLKCRIYGEAGACKDGCMCVDTSWNSSNFLGKGDLAIHQFKLFFQKEGYMDDGRTVGRGTPRKYDEFGVIPARGKEVYDWFKHWSKSTYGACSFDHTSTSPPLVFSATDKWKGNYDPDKNVITLAPGAARTDTRVAWRGSGFHPTSNFKFYDASRESQPDYNLAGFELANKVYQHEYGHYLSIKAYWDPGGLWQRQVGNRTTTDVVERVLNTVGTRDCRVEYVSVMGDLNILPGQFGPQPKSEHGKDAVQKYKLNILVNRTGPQGQGNETIPLSDAWFMSTQPKTPNAPLLHGIFKQDNQSTKYFIDDDFDVMTADRRYVKRGRSLTVYLRAKDEDGDYLPNLVEDTIGTSWHTNLSHPTHARAKKIIDDEGRTYVPDQEFWADRYALRQLQAILKDPEKDWANPGAQSIPPYKPAKK
jgi:hypothetical protein